MFFGQAELMFWCLCYTQVMRLLGIDYGSKRVGIAVSDEEQKYAFPKAVIPNDKKLLEEVTKYCIELEVEKIIIGDSKDYDMKPNKIMEQVLPFVEELRLKTKLPVEFELEYLTSAAAEHFKHRRQRRDSGPDPREEGKHLLDASAAALILQSYLDKKKQ